MRFFILILAFVATLAIPAFAQDTYTVRVEDQLSVTVLDHPELTREFVVLSDGRFSFPVVGSVDAAGKTTDHIGQEISRGLKKELANPQVSVSVSKPADRRVYISGLVAKPGAYDMKAGWRVSNLIAESGGLGSGSTGGALIAYRPESVRAVVIRGQETIPVDVDAVLSRSERSSDIELQSGDLLQVQPDTNLVHVVGQVRNPGDYQVKNGLGTAEAVSAAGGTTEKAALTRSTVIRGQQVIAVDLRAVLVEGRADANMELKAGDTLLIPANENRIAVLGGVVSAGYIDLPDGKPVTVADAIGLAKGSKPRAKLGEVALIRDAGGKQVVSKLNFSRYLRNGDLSQNPVVQSGDVVFIPDPNSVDKEALYASSGAQLTAGVLSASLIKLLFR